MENKDLNYWNGKVYEAFSRLKAYLYYDNFNLLLRSKLAAFESEPDFLEKLDLLANNVFTYLSTGELSDKLQQAFEAIDYNLIPKKFAKAAGTSKILFSNRLDETFEVTKATYLIECEIELHLIATLWIIEDAYQLFILSGRDSYGYHLQVDTEEKKLDGKNIFSKYFDKYQQWRDKGIKAATSQIADGNDVLLLSLDIKDFFHSVNIDFASLKKDLSIQEEPSLTDLVAKISSIYSRKIGCEKMMLPIGIVSSGVIANWLLKPFDREVKNKLGPVYYGRYVDDIFIVLSNIQFPKAIIDKSSGKEDFGNWDSQILEWLTQRFFHEGPLKKTNNDGKDMFEFEGDRYDGLQIQGDKLKVFYFSPDWPQAMLNKFQKALEENSSIFWFLPNEEDSKDSFDDDAFDLHYEDSINKFRSVSDLKTSKYGASVFLAKRIKLAILNESGGSDEDINKQIFRFFNGRSVVELYNLWEKVLTYFVVVHDKKNLNKFLNKVKKGIGRLSGGEQIKKLKEDLERHLSISLSMAVGLNPDLISTIEIFKKDELTDDLDNFRAQIKNLRNSVLLRHHYLPLPILILTDYRKSLDSLISGKLIYKILKGSATLLISEDLLQNKWRIPRRVFLQEISMLQMLNLLNKWNGNSVVFNKQLKENRLEVEDELIATSLKLFGKLNDGNLEDYLLLEKFKAYKTEKEQDHELMIYTEQITFPKTSSQKKLKIGLTNAKLEEKDLKEAIKTRSNINNGKRAKHIHLINEAERLKVDILILPETAVPINWLYAYSDDARRKNRAFIFGLEHFPIKNYCINLSVCLLPFRYGNIQDVLIIPRLKNHYSPGEISEIEKWGKLVPKIRPHIYHLYKWRGLQFTLYNCYELTDVVQRSIFRSELDILFAIEYNKDVNYFSNIAESTCRDLHCFYVQANTSQYGDTRIVAPKETALMNPVRVKGGDNDVILTATLDIEELREFQSQYPPYQWSDRRYKCTPPDFDHEAPKRRGK